MEYMCDGIDFSCDQKVMMSKILNYIILLKMFGFHIIASNTSNHNITIFLICRGEYYINEN